MNWVFAIRCRPHPDISFYNLTNLIYNLVISSSESASIIIVP